MELNFAGLKAKETGFDADDASERLRKQGRPLVLEVESIVDEHTFSAALVLPAFGAPADTVVHVKQVTSLKHLDSLTRHIQGNSRTAALRKGDIVTIDRAFLHDGDAYTNRLSSRTHDFIKGNVQLVFGPARPSMTTVNAKGALQSLVIADGSEAYRADNEEDVSKVFDIVRSKPWPGGSPGFVIRNLDGYTFEYFVNKENPFSGLIDSLADKQWMGDGQWIELLPAWKLPMGQDQVARDVDPRKEQPRTLGMIGRRYMSEKGKFPGFVQSAIIVCDEDVFEFGGRNKFGKRHRVAAGLQPISTVEPVESRHLPSRIRPSYGTVLPVSTLFGEESVRRLTAERAERNPGAEQSSQEYSGQEDERPAEKEKGPPAMIFGMLGK